MRAVCWCPSQQCMDSWETMNMSWRNVLDGLLLGSSYFSWLWTLSLCSLLWSNKGSLNWSRLQWNARRRLKRLQNQQIIWKIPNPGLWSSKNPLKERKSQSVTLKTIRLFRGHQRTRLNQYRTFKKTSKGLKLEEIFSWKNWKYQLIKKEYNRMHIKIFNYPPELPNYKGCKR